MMGDGSGRALMTVKEVANELGLSTFTIRRWIHQRHLPCVKLPNKTYRIPRVSVDKILAVWTVDRMGL
jgi:excisionase family DNA binding protein